MCGEVSEQGSIMDAWKLADLDRAEAWQLADLEPRG